LTKKKKTKQTKKKTGCQLLKSAPYIFRKTIIMGHSLNSSADIL